MAELVEHGLAIQSPEVQLLFYYLLLAYSPVNRSGSPQGFSQVKFRTQVEYNTKHAHYINVKHNPKGSPFGIALVKNGK